MYKLYNMSRGIKLIDQSPDENDIKETLGECMTTGDTIDYEIRNAINNLDEITIVKIHNFQDYMNYVMPEKEKTLTKHL